jgi:hypothetical protein
VLSVSPTTGSCVEGGTVQLTAIELTGLINSALVYTWSFGTATTSTITYPCTTAGVVTVSVTAAGPLTAVAASVASSITMSNAIASATFSPASAAVGDLVSLTVPFTDAASPNNLHTLTVVWGDGSVNTQLTTTIASTRVFTTSHSFIKPGQARQLSVSQ